MDPATGRADGAPDRLPRARQGSPTSLLLTLFGDYWLERSEPLPSAALVSLLGDFDVSEHAARAALSRMVKKDLLTSSRTGRNTSYRLTPRTVTILRAGLRRMVDFGRTQPPWDGTWSILVAPLPENEPVVRAAVRSRLRWLGYAALADGAWLAPRDHQELALDQLRQLGVRTATAFSAVVPPNGAGDRPPQSAWELDELAASYHRLILDAESLARAVDRGRVSPAEALVRRTRLTDSWLDLARADPDLPWQLLPEGWPRARAREAFLTAHDLLGDRATDRVAEAVSAVAPWLAGLVVHRSFTDVDDAPDAATPPAAAATGRADAAGARAPHR